MSVRSVAAFSLLTICSFSAAIAEAAPPHAAPGKPAPHAGAGAAVAVAAPHPAPHASPGPIAYPLPFLPTLARVAIDQVGARLIVTEDVRIPRGEWTGGDLDLYISFGAPGSPRAIDAHLFPLATGSPTSATTVTLARSPRCPGSAHTFLGPRAMAGVVAHVTALAFRNATASGDAVFRVRSVLDVPAADEGGAREVLVRLGAIDGEPIGLERVELGAGLGTLSDASVHLCGNDADPYPLAFSVAAPTHLPITYPRGEAPHLATRHASDSLCVDWTK